MGEQEMSTAEREAVENLIAETIDYEGGSPERYLRREADIRIGWRAGRAYSEQLLIEECEKCGLPVSLPALLRHIRGNKDMIIGFGRIEARTWRERAERAEQELQVLAELLQRASDYIATGVSGDHAALKREIREALSRSTRETPSDG